MINVYLQVEAFLTTTIILVLFGESDFVLFPKSGILLFSGYLGINIMSAFLSVSSPILDWLVMWSSPHPL